MDVFSTAGVPAREGFAFWREVNAKTWAPSDARCDPHLEGRFQAQVNTAEFGAIEVSLMTTTPYSMNRTPKLIRQSDPEAFKLCASAYGRDMFTQDGRWANIGAGDLLLCDTSRPYQGRMAPVPAVRTVILQFPHALLPLPERDLRRLTAVRIRGDRAAGALASNFLMHLALRMDEFGPAEGARVAGLTLDLLTTVLAGMLDARRAVPSPARRRALLVRIHAFIEANLGDPDLTPGMIAAAHHISLRQLHKLFQVEGNTVAAWIRERRLRQCRRDLADPRMAARTIAAIAARWGFGSPAHFSQAFRGAYGVSPREFRREHARAHAD
ncbi:helix-turn-helix domain-containing protein [Actinomadura sp. WMMB 499]|nr:helix-turn-helix domain-containing protein [Actinomadura sp. WMMB 499]QFG23709.1 helix-turn-helix domain-containing protein [Actinomadura sp. WMMB 499]